MNPGRRFVTYNEMIYHTSGHTHYITKASSTDRYLEEADNTNILQLCAEQYNIPVNQVNINILREHPIVRTSGTNKLTVSAMEINGKGINLAAKVTIGNAFKFSEAVDTAEEAKHTLDYLKSQLPSLSLIIGFNCIFRYTQFVSEGRTSSNYNILRRQCPYFACTTLGEQYGYNQINQSLSLVAFE